MVHTFEMHGLKLALDVESGALHVLDSLAFEAVRRLDDGLDTVQVASWLSGMSGEANAVEVMAEIEELRTGGLLFSDARTVNDEPDGVIKALCLHLAHDCNMRCRYCFASSGSYGGSRGLMPADVARQAVDFLMAASGSRKHCEIDFFGGEPLLNMAVLKETVEYGRRRAQEKGKVLQFTVTTNGLSLDEDIRRYLNEEAISVVFSLDGRQDTHDRMRRLPGGGGSFKQVLANCKSLVQSRGGDNYYLRGTYTRHNLDFCRDVRVMLNEGFERISLEPVVLAPGTEESLRPEDLPLLKEEYKRLAAELWEWECRGRPVRFFHFELDLDQGPCARKRVLGCGAGTAYLAVAPDGSLSPCHQFVGLDEFCAGHVCGDADRGVLAPFFHLGMGQKASCSSCFARYFCGGGCHASAWTINGSLLEPYVLGCELHRIRVECGLFLQAARMLSKTGR
jgi:uncharacterized protein